ncbi:MAG: hypothetical protein ACE5IJ_08960, partial [Thermoplasmata archaeon]
YGGANGNETDPTLSDTDLDGLNDYEELLNNTNPLLDDTDGDGLTDGDEVKVYGTNATNHHSDGDELTDGEEINGVFGYITEPLMSDTDEDGLYDHEEMNLGYNPLNPDMDGDGLIDGKDLQPLAYWPDVYPAPETVRRTLEFRGHEYEQLINYGFALDNGTDELALVLDQGSLASPMMPVWDKLGYPIGTSIISQDIIAYTEGKETNTSFFTYGTDLGILSAADNLFTDIGYQVKWTPVKYGREPWEFVENVQTLDFSRANFTITLDNFEEVPSPGGFFHRFLEWELTPHATNTITVQFGMNETYDESYETNTSWKLPGFALRLFHFTGIDFEEVFSSIFPAEHLGDHYYQVDMSIPPGPSSVLRWPHENFVVDLMLVWVDQDMENGTSLEPLLPYRYEHASIGSIEVGLTDFESTGFGCPFSCILDTIRQTLGIVDLTWDDLAKASALLDYLSRSFKDLIENDEVLSELESVPFDLDWTIIRDVANEISKLGFEVEYILNIVTDAGHHGIEDIVVSANLNLSVPVEILRVSSITTIAKYDNHIILPKEYVTVEEAVSAFTNLSLDLVASPTQGHANASRTLFFYNVRNADEADNQTLADMAENGSGADILIISAESQREIGMTMEPLNWSGVWSKTVDDTNQTEDYNGSYFEGDSELHDGVRQIRIHGGRGGREVYANGSFYYDPGDVLVATSNASALPVGVSEGFLHQRLPPPEERWVFRNLSTPQGSVYESVSTTYIGDEELIENVKVDFSVERNTLQYETILKNSDNVDDVLPKKSLRKIRGIKVALGVLGVIVVWDTYNDAAVAHQQGEDIYAAIIILDGLVDVYQISYTIYRISKLAPIPPAVSKATVAIGILYYSYFMYKATQADTALEAEFYVMQATIYLGDFILLAVPGGGILQMAILGTTWVLYKLGFLSRSYTFTSGIMSLMYWLNGCDVPEDRMDQLQEIQDKLEKISDWLDDQIQSHVDNGEIAFFVGGISLVAEAEELAEGGC